MAQNVPPFDEATLDALQARLYPRLKETLLVAVQQEREQVPPYYEQYVGSEIRRLEEAIKWNGQRIDEASEQLNRRIDEVGEQLNRRIDEVGEQLNRRIDSLQAYVDQRFEQVDQRFEQIDRRFEQIDRRFDHLERRLDEMNVRFRNWALAATAFLGILITALSFLLR